MSKSDISVIIPFYGKHKETRMCVNSIIRHEKDTNFEIILIDDGSEETYDGADHPSIEYLANEFREGTTKAWIKGALFAEADVLLFLNNDTLFTKPILQEFIKGLQSHPLIGCETRLEKAVNTNTLSMGKYLQGWCFSVSREDYDAVGGFDEDYELYFSDTDFQLKIDKHTQLMEPIGVVKEHGIKHQGHITCWALPNRKEIWMSDRAVFNKKWGI